MRNTRFSPFILLCLALVLSACGPDASDDPITDPDDGPSEAERVESLRQDVRQLIADNDIEPLQKNQAIDPNKVKLGQALFFDSILSGNKDTSCGTCHRPMQATVDGVSIPAGTMARHDATTGARIPGPEQDYMPRNVPDLFNRGHEEFRTFFWDTRIQRVENEDGSSNMVFFDRLDGYAPKNLFRVMDDEMFSQRMLATPDNLLAAQNMFPVLNRDELRGARGHVDMCGEVNELAQIEDFDPETAWAQLMARLLDIPGYRELFAAAYPSLSTEQLSFVHAANGLSAFIEDAYTLTDAPWDRFVAGEDEALSEAALRGATIFYGKGTCNACHTGTLMTDQNYYNIGIAPLGSGPSSRVSTGKKLDRGVAHRSLAGPDEAFKFRTPPLRNVELTGPYMHTGAYNTLEAVVRHKNNAYKALWNYDVRQLRPEFQSELHRERESYEAVEATLDPLFQSPLGLTEDEIQDLVAFLEALTSPQAHDLSHTAPESVPSGLPINIPPNPNLPSEDGYALDVDYTDYCAARAAALKSQE